MKLIPGAKYPPDFVSYPEKIKLSGINILLNLNVSITEYILLCKVNKL